MRLLSFLKIRKINQYHFALIIGVASNTVSQYVNGVIMPSKVIIQKIHEVTNGLVSYADWYDKKENKEDAKRLKRILKEKRIKLQNVASFLGYSGSRLSQKFADNSFSDKEIANIIYYINHVNPITGEIIEAPVSENRGYVKAKRNLNLLVENKLKPRDITLLYIIANRANKSNIALIGDYAKFGLTKQEYISAKRKLEQLGWCTFTGVPQKGTIAKLLSNPLFEP